MKALQNKLNNRKIICFIDFEGTQYTSEIIAFGCVKAYLRKDGSVRRFKKGIYSLVNAKNRVGKIVTNLTGISDNMVKSGVTFVDALKQIKKYMGKDFEKAAYVTYGNYDLKMLEETMKRHKNASKPIYNVIEKNFFDFENFINAYVRDSRGNTYSLTNILKVFNLTFKGTAHDPLADAMNLGYLYNAFVKKTDIVEEEYKKVLLRGKHLPAPLQNVVRKLNNGEVVTPEDYHTYVAESLK